MKTHFLRLLIVMLALVCLRCSSGDDYFISNDRKIAITDVNGEIAKLMDDIGIPGLSLAVIENNQTVFYEGYGHRTMEKMEKVEKETVFEACSLSKTLLVFVAHQLVDEGKLDLDKPIYEYMTHERLEHDPRYKLITARMILSHSSGIENWQWENNLDVLEIISEPGTAFVYSGEGYEYLAEVMALLTGESYEEYIDHRVIKPLGLQNTYLKFSSMVGDDSVAKYLPANYTIGHNKFDEPYQKWTNFGPAPAAGVNLTAEDYAKLIIAIFDGRHLSKKTISDIARPVVPIGKNDSTSYLGMGFEIIYSNGDTILTHYGSNPGFKAKVYYSVTGHRGFVFLTNHDNGSLISKKINNLTTQFDVDHTFEDNYYSQYPSQALSILKTFKDDGLDSMFKEIESLSGRNQLKPDAVNELAEIFLVRDRAITRRLAELNVKAFPESAAANRFMGALNVEDNEFDGAFKNLEKARELGYDPAEIDYQIARGKSRMLDNQARSKLLTSIDAKKGRRLQAEDYYLMSGIGLSTTIDVDGGGSVKYIDTGDWIEYRINTATGGMHEVKFRVASFAGGNQFEVRQGSNVLTVVDVPATNDWEKWTSLSANINLQQGDQTIRLYITKGGFDFNWMELAKISQ